MKVILVLYWKEDMVLGSFHISLLMLFQILLFQYPPEEVINTFILLSKALSSESCFYLEDFRETASIKSVQLGVSSDDLQVVLSGNEHFVLNDGMFGISAVDRTKNVEIHLTREKAITIYTEVNDENQEVWNALLRVLADLDVNYQNNHKTIYNSDFNYHHMSLDGLDDLILVAS